MFILYQSMRICKDGLSSLRVDLTNYKDEVPNVSDSNQNIETTCKLIKLKDLFIKSTEKNIQRWMCVSHKNSKTLKLFRKVSFQIMSLCLQLWMLLVLMILKSISQHKCQGLQKPHNCSIILHLEVANVYIMLTWCCVLSDLIQRISNYT